MSEWLNSQNLWGVLDLQEDPTPGDPAQLQELATRLRREADYADHHTDRLRSLAANSPNLRMQGDYAPASETLLAGLPEQSADLGPAHRACAGALAEYADILEQAKVQAGNALSRGLQADAQYTGLLQQFYAIAPVTAPAGGVWRGLNEATALEYTQAASIEVQEEAARIGFYAGQAEQERQDAAQTARQAAQMAGEAEQQCANAIRAVKPAPPAARRGSSTEPVTAGTGPGGTAPAAGGTGGADGSGPSSPARSAVQEPAVYGRPQASRTECGDPVDVATGHVIMTQTDITLPGALPVVFTRAHDSGLRAGRWMGPSWICSADERVEIDDEGAVLVGADGVLLAYPHPTTGQPVLPATGARIPLTVHADGSFTATDPDTGLTRTYTRPHPMSSFARLTEVRDRNGHWTAYDYADTGVPLGIRNSAGQRIRIDVSGERITALYLAGAAPDGSDLPLVRFGYTDGHLNDVITSSGLPLRFAYDGEGRMASWTDRNGTHYRYRYDDRHRCVEQGGTDGHLAYRYDYDGRDPETGHRVTAVTDSLGHTTRYTVNDARQGTAVTDPLGHTTRYTRDQHDRLLSRTDPLGHTTTYTYDGDHLTAVTFPDATRLSAVRNRLGLPTVVTEPDGAVWRREYDERGNLTAVTDPSGAITHYAYDTRGHLASVTNALGAVTTVRCDAAGLPVEVTDPLGAATRYERDAFGRVITVTDPMGATERMEWTIEGKPARRTAADGATETWTYDGEGNCLTHTDAIGGVTVFEYTHFDLPAARTDPDGTRYEFAHDTELRLTVVTNPQGLTWAYVYDPAGRLTAETDFDGRNLTYTHDPAGRLLSRTDPLGQTTTLARDAAGQVVHKQAGDRTTTFTYDPAGRLLSAANPDAELVYQRDRLGRVTSETTDGRVLSFTYDALGRRVRRTTPSGATTTYAYDPAGRRTTLTTAGHTLDFTHDPAGRETARRIGDTLTLASAWDPAGRLSEQLLTAGPTRVVQSRTYTYRADGYLTRIDDHLNGPRTFNLDQTGRVTAVHARDWTETYAYDPAGNQTHATWPTSHPDAEATGPRAYTGTRITRAGTIRYEHDAADRLTLRQKTRLSRKPDTWRYEWDAEDHLTSVTTPDGIVWRYLYDPLGRRTAKQRLGADGQVAEEIRFTWDGPALIEQTTTGADPNQATLTWDHDGFRPLIQTERSSDATTQNEIDQRFFAIITDLVGTPTELVDETGDIAWQARRTLWGTTTSSATATASTPLRFPGQYHDPETGLHYNLNRHYDPSTGRYTTIDPLGLSPAANPATYVHNPHSRTDYLGLSPDCGNRSHSVQRIDPREIRHSQTSVNGAAERINEMRAHGWIVDPVDVVQMPDGGLTAIDNTRVLAARVAGIDAEAVIHPFDEPLPNQGLIDRFATRKGVPSTWGEAVMLRIGKQASAFRNRWPMGSPVTSWDGN